MAVTGVTLKLTKEISLLKYFFSNFPFPNPFLSYLSEYP